MLKYYKVLIIRIKEHLNKWRNTVYMVWKSQLVYRFKATHVKMPESCYDTCINMLYIDKSYINIYMEKFQF